MVNHKVSASGSYVYFTKPLGHLFLLLILIENLSSHSYFTVLSLIRYSYFFEVKRYLYLSSISCFL